MFFERAFVSSPSLKDAYFTFTEWNTAMRRGTCEPADILKARSFTATNVLLQKCTLITCNGLLLQKLTVA